MQQGIYDFALALVEYVEASAFWLSQILEECERNLLHFDAGMALLAQEVPEDVETLRQSSAGLAGALERLEDAIETVHVALDIDADDDQVLVGLQALSDQFRRLSQAFPCTHCSAATRMYGLGARETWTCLTCGKTSDMPANDDEGDDES